MPSKLEDALLRCAAQRGQFQPHLFRLLEASALRSLRQTSRAMHDIIDHEPGKLFRKLFLNLPAPPETRLERLRIVAPLCWELVVKVGIVEQGSASRDRESQEKKTRQLNWAALEKGRGSQHSRHKWRSVHQALRLRSKSLVTSASAGTATASSFSGSQAPTPTSAQRPPCFLPSLSNEKPNTHQTYAQLLSPFHQLRKLTLRTSPTTPSSTLTSLRTALETLNLPNLTTIHLPSLLITYLLPIRWSGLSAYHLASTTAYTFWHNIQHISLSIHNPFPSLSPPQRSTWHRILHSYLSSFAPRLQSLKFIWLGDEPGPSPLALDLEEDAQKYSHVPVRTIEWPELTELWLGNVTFPHRTIEVLSARAPRLEKVRMLRRSASLQVQPDRERDVGGEDAEAGSWMEVLLNRDQYGPEGWWKAPNDVNSHNNESGANGGSGASRTTVKEPWRPDSRRYVVK